MKPEELCDIIGEIDEQYITQANGPAKGLLWLKRLAPVACLAIVAVVGVLLWHFGAGSSPAPTTPPVLFSSPINSDDPDADAVPDITQLPDDPADSAPPVATEDNPNSPVPPDTEGPPVSDPTEPSVNPEEMGLVFNTPTAVISTTLPRGEYSDWSEYQSCSIDQALSRFTGLYYDHFLRLFTTRNADSFTVYTQLNPETGDYIPRDFNFYYMLVDGNEIMVGVSAEGYPLRETSIQGCADDVASTVNGVPMLIYQQGGAYYAYFRLGEIYLDVQTTHLTPGELQALLARLTLVAAPLEEPTPVEGITVNKAGYYKDDDSYYGSNFYDWHLAQVETPESAFEIFTSLDYDAFTQTLSAPWIFTDFYVYAHLVHYPDPEGWTEYCPRDFTFNYIKSDAKVQIGVSPAGTPKREFVTEWLYTDPCSCINGVTMRVYELEALGEDVYELGGFYYVTFELEGLYYDVLTNCSLEELEQILSDLTA